LKISLPESPAAAVKSGIHSLWQRSGLRVFGLESGADAQQAKVAALEKAGQPVVPVTLVDVHDLAQEFFRWEIATAVFDRAGVQKSDGIQGVSCRSVATTMSICRFPVANPHSGS
jgi:hypothetical protein